MYANINESNVPRLFYLDWLKMLALLSVFLFQTVHPLDDRSDWHIKTAERCVLETYYVGFFYLWEMSIFFIIAVTRSWFSLRSRTPGSYIRSRVTRFLIPFILGSMMLMPIRAYYRFIHKSWWEGIRNLVHGLPCTPLQIRILTPSVE